MNLREFIEENLNLIDSTRFEELYKNANRNLSANDVGQLTLKLHLAGIEPELYLDELPSNFLRDAFEPDFTIPPNITKINRNAINAKNLRKLIIPATVSTISQYGIDGDKLHIYCLMPEKPSGWNESWCYTYNSTKIYWDTKNIEKISPEGFEYYISNAGAVIMDYHGKARDLVIPEMLDNYPVVKISPYAFHEMNFIATVSLPDSLQVIGNGAFYACKNLQYIDIPKSITYLGRKPFAHCISLKKALMNANITMLPDECFLGCEELSEVILSPTVVEIGARAFEYSNIQSIDLSHIKVIQADAFRSTPIAELKLDGVIEIENSAFSGCNKLTELVIPKSVQKLGKYCFYSCINLRDVDVLMSSNTIPESCFESTAITQINIPAQIEIIEDSAFSKCNINNLIIPNTIKDIRSRAFDNTNLKEVTIPEGVTYIDLFAFGKSLEKINLPRSIKQLSSDHYFDHLEIYYSGTKADWKNIDKIDQLTGTYFTVYCSDGKITKKKRN